MGPALVAVTFGADGSYAVCADGAQRIPAYPTEVVDTVGAGDAFMTGLIDALWDHGLLGALTARPIARDRARRTGAGVAGRGVVVGAHRRPARRGAAGPSHPRPGRKA